MRLTKAIFLCILALLCTTDIYGQKKRAQTSMKFLSVSPSARASALSGAVTSVEMGAYSALYNPSTMAYINGTYTASVGAVQWIADINHNSATLVYQPADGKFGVIGVNAISVDYGDILSTARADNEQGYVDLGTINPTAFAVGLSYANAITDQFSVGANFRYSNQNLGSAAISTDGAGNYEMQSFSAGTGVLDFGVLYKTGFRSLNFGMALRNFSPEVDYDDEGAELPLTFKIGVSMDVLDLTDLNPDVHSLLVSIDANRPRDYDEQLLFGLEYTFIDRFVLRGGYGFPKDEEKLSFGAGIKQPIGPLVLSVDYAYTQFGVFGEVNRFSAQIGF
ncbi:PorV/PorQ family protein [Gracilimonas sp. BCB1]|uniref:PorV/PorQ family protein n=1 Tax=Gracilimonas sp. BCB1 TaxID=3152362 RepID=UPI0032D91950